MRILPQFIASLSLGLSATTLALAANPFHKVAATDLPAIQPEGDIESFRTALTRQIEACQKLDPKETFTIGARKVTRKNWCIDTAQKFLQLIQETHSFDALMTRARVEFEWYATEGRDGHGEVLFTGYNFPTLSGVTTADALHSVPLYRKPQDLVRVGNTWKKKNADGSFQAYPDRKSITVDHVLAGQGLELAYMSDPFDTFIFEIQGAGAIQLKQPDGTVRRMVLNYVAENGQPYVPLARVLRDQGVAPEYQTIPGMRRYFREHPEQLISNLNKNPSYVFFEEIPDGPYGVQKIPLTAGHSIAIDTSVFPVGSVAFMKTDRPIADANGDVASWQPFSRLAVAQDTGGAIRGPGRIDIYWGEDAYADLAAGTMAQTGSAFIAVLPEPTQ